MTTAHVRAAAAGSSPAAGSSKIAPNRGLLPPLLAWSASAGASAPAVDRLEHVGQRATPSVRTTSSSRGWSTTATSDPPAKIDLAAAPREVVADEVGAERPELARARHRAEREPAGRRRAAGAAGRRRRGPGRARR